MANQKITDLNKLINLSSDDLFIVVDRNSKSNSSSPTGETKGITASDLANELNKIVGQEVGIKFKNLNDVPDSYDGFQDGYVKIKKDGTGVEFTDSPGASEQTFNGDLLETYINGSPQTYTIGDVLYVQPNKKFAKASCVNIESSEAIGLIRKIKYKDDVEQNTTTIDKFSVVFNGLISWDWDITNNGGPIKLEKRSINLDSVTTILENQYLVPGTTYFLGSDGTLMDFDTTEETSFSDYVSKPMLIANTPTSGIIMNYRGLMCNSDEQPHKFIVSEPASCNSIKAGDVLRIKRSKVRKGIDNFTVTSIYDDSLVEENVLPSFLGRESGTTEYALCNSASQLKTSGDDAPVEDDRYGCDMLGIVTLSTGDYFEIQTSGMVEFEIPEYDTEQTIISGGIEENVKKPLADGLFIPGYTYYIESFPLNSDQIATTNQTLELRNSIYDYSSEELGSFINNKNTILAEKLRPLLNGTSPFRNTTIIDPFNRDHATGKVISYSKAAFYAVTKNKILILNSPAYPNPKDRCNAVDPTTWSPCSYSSRDERSFTLSKTKKIDTQTDIEDISNEFLKSAWSSATTNDLATLTIAYEIQLDSGEILDEFETHEFVKMDNTQNSNWKYVRRLS